VTHIRVERLDHHGLVAGIIDELNIVEHIDARIEADVQETVTAGEAVKAMIINGLGFSNRPLMLTPQFFENLPMELLFRSGVEAEHFNRHKLGRTLDEVYQYGCDALFSEIALSACAQEGVDVRHNSLDSTSFSLTGQYDVANDEQAIRITYGHSKDYRPDLKQAVEELLVSQDGGIPLFMKIHDGNASDSRIFRERAQALIEEFKNSSGPRYLIAASQTLLKERRRGAGATSLYHPHPRDAQSGAARDPRGARENGILGRADANLSLPTGRPDPLRDRTTLVNHLFRWGLPAREPNPVKGPSQGTSAFGQSRLSFAGAALRFPKGGGRSLAGTGEPAPLSSPGIAGVAGPQTLCR
jgi:hypothetical protein